MLISCAVFYFEGLFCMLVNTEVLFIPSKVKPVVAMRQSSVAVVSKEKKAGFPFENPRHGKWETLPQAHCTVLSLNLPADLKDFMKLRICSLSPRCILYIKTRCGQCAPSYRGGLQNDLSL